MKIAIRNLKGDLFGGLTAAIVALPLALAFGVSSGLGAIAGLYGAIALGILAALFGGTKTQISGPTGPMVVVASSVVSAQILYFGSLELAMPSILATFVLAGVLQIAMGLSRIGTYIRYMPYPVISGFMSGIGVIIIILQIFPFFGLKSPTTIIDTLVSLGNIPAQINVSALFLSLGTIATIYLFPKVTKAVPSTLVALFLFTIIALILNLDVPKIGEIPSGLPEIHWDSLIPTRWHDPVMIFISAITLASLGAIDSLLTSVVADNLTRTKHDSNRELIGQGIGNSVAGLFGGLPGAGATMRTVVNIKSGGKTQVSGVVHGFILLIILMGAGSLAEVIPLSVLAGILITVGIGIIDYKGLKDIKYIPRADAFIMVAVLLLTVLVDLLQAVAVGMVMASFWFMKHMSDIVEEKATGTFNNDILPDEKDLNREGKRKVYFQHFDGPIFFGFTFGFQKILREMPEVDTIVFRMNNVPYIDQSGLYALEDALQELLSKNIKVYICCLNTQPKDMLDKIKITPNLIKKEQIFSKFDDLKEELLKA